MKCCINNSVFPAGLFEHACIAGTLQSSFCILDSFHLTETCGLGTSISAILQMRMSSPQG